MANLNVIQSINFMSHGVTMGIASGFPLRIKMYM
jgi:hypothetical protein